MKLYEIILLIISEFGDRIAGRTKVQKMCYFYSKLKNKEMGFRPHYYGPYSPAVENALDELEGIGLIDKKIKIFGENQDGFEVKRYDYEITKYGKQVVDTIEDCQEKRDLHEFVEKIKKAGIPGTMDISIAAKAFYILDRENIPLTHEEIRKKAGTFGWNIDPNAINRATAFLNAFGFIEQKNV
jgi:uncharacterized protein YwgA